MNPSITIEGRLTADPEMRFLPSGVALCSFTVVTSDRKKNEADAWEDVDPTFFRCTAWRQLAENLAESLSKGDPVLVQGKLSQRKYTDKEGAEKTNYQEVNVFAAGPNLVMCTATVNRAKRGSTGASANDDPWGGKPADTSEPPF